ncbi:GNAT family N-acetyltransferase [Pseudoroseomonas rhizosphaerae]|uniref:GNAT family N-acetyltransferase n=1 Tax=Teichococcus rhizosphaerae TaxID=1335062 RepID=A0A2C7ABN8_9PROT|nr:GNAT family N-acetyltransferase [Pseudoroseomonas rhizosphaerae]PHK94815.1 GNAT family N-acetyltransferase [Pseudoroseomonas rhizosphaerae]
MQGRSWQGVSVMELERASHTAVPALRTAFDGPFLLRAFLGGTGRANAASSLDPAQDAGLPARLERIAENYRRLGLAPRFRSTPLDPPGLEEALLERGYREADASLVMAGPLAAFATPGATPDAALEVLPAPTEEWLAVVATAEYQTEQRRAEKLRAPALMMVPAAWLVLRVEGQAAAVGQVAADGRLLGFFDIATAPAFRRQGLARRLLAAAAAWGRAQGGTTGWLQVSAANAPARALYEALGLREIYRYRYFLPG